MLVDGRAPGDVVHGAAAGDARRLGRRIERDRAAAALAAQLVDVVAGGLGVHDLGQQLRAGLGASRVDAHRVEALQPVLGRDLGVLGGQRLVAAGVDGQLVTEALRICEPQPVAVAHGLDAVVRKSLLPEVDRLRSIRRA